MGSVLVHDSLLFLLSAGVAILVLVTARETIPTWYSSFGSSPIGALVRCSGCLFGDAILRCFFCSVVTRCTSPLRMVLGVHVLSRMFLLYSVYWLHAVVALCQL